MLVPAVRSCLKTTRPVDSTVAQLRKARQALAQRVSAGKSGRPVPERRHCFSRTVCAGIAVHRLAASLILLVVFGATLPAQTQPAKDPPDLLVAAAADLSSVLTEAAHAYEQRSRIKVKLAFGASGALTQQIENGAPFDVFFSADMDYPLRLIAHHDADAATLQQYAVGKLVLWVPSTSHLDVEHEGMKALLDPSVKKIAIANPEHAPYGRAAVAALRHAGLYDRLSGRLVLGENVSQAAQFVESGNAQAGLLALAHALAPGMQAKGRSWEIPPDSYPPLEQGVVVLSRSQHKEEAADFLRFIRSKTIAELLHKSGFATPEDQHVH
jgi:molybdate transport system substrate-binding protein